MTRRRPSSGACRRKAVARARSRTSPAASGTSTSRLTANAPSWSRTSGCASAARPKIRRLSKSTASCSSGTGEGYLDDRTQQLFIVDLATGKARQLTSGQRDHWHPVWSPDGTSLAYTAKERGETDRDSNYEVFVQRVDAGEPKKISQSAGPDNDPDWGGRPAWSPDSRRVLWLEGGEAKWLYYATPQLAVADVATGEVTRPARIDRWFYYPRFAPDGSILALVEQDRDTWLARITGDQIEYLGSGKRFGSEFAVAANGRVALVESDVSTPAEIFAVDGHRQLTHHNDWVAEPRARRSARRFVQQRRRGDSRLHHAARGLRSRASATRWWRNFMAVLSTSTAMSSSCVRASTRLPATRCWR